MPIKDPYDIYQQEQELRRKVENAPVVGRIGGDIRRGNDATGRVGPRPAMMLNPTTTDLERAGVIRPYDAAADTNPGENTFMGRRLTANQLRKNTAQAPEPDPQVAPAAQAGAVDRSGETENERKQRIKDIDNALGDLSFRDGGLNMRSKRELFGQLLAQKSGLTGARIGQLGDADRNVNAVNTANAGSVNDVNKANAELRDRGMLRRANREQAAATAAETARQNEFGNHLRTNADQRANELHEATIREKTNAGVSAEVRAEMQATGADYATAARAVTDRIDAAGDNRRATSIGRADDTAFGEELKTLANRGNFLSDLREGNFASLFGEASVPSGKRVRPQDFVEKDLGYPLPGSTTSFEYTGDVPEGQTRPHFYISKDDPRAERLRRKNEPADSGY